MHGDRVVVRVEHRRDGDRAEGRILRILERSAQRVVGRYDVENSGLGFVVPFDRRILMDVQVPKGEAKGARRGDMVTVEITRWPTSTRPALGRVVEVIGDLDAPGVDTTVIIRKYNLPGRAHRRSDCRGQAARDQPSRNATSSNAPISAAG